MVLRVVGVGLVAGLVAAALVARWYYGRRQNLTDQWRPILGAHGTEVSLEKGVKAVSMPRTRLPEEAVLFRVEGDAPGDYFGFSVAGLGDVTGDGVPDFAVGAHQNENLGPRPNMNAPPGYVRVFSGADASELYTLAPTGSLKIDGADDKFGWSFTPLGDIDGDGASDLAVGAFLFDAEDPDESEVDENTGAVFVFSGATGRQLAYMGGERWGDRFGFCLAAIPDRDGDGRPDLLVGVEKGETVERVKNAGRLEAYSTATWEQLVHSDGPGWEAHLGCACASLGDVDGDGVADYAGGAFMYAAKEEADAERGAAGVMSGRTGEILHGWEGAGRFDHLGCAITGLGDVDGDGVDDLAIGADQSGLTGDYYGPGYVRLQSCADGRLLDVLVGETLGDQFGWAVVDIGDRDGDGVHDLLVGAPASITVLKENLDRPGRVYVFSGRDRRLLTALEGPLSNDQFGAAAAPLGDLDGDGLSEILIGAPQNVADQTLPGYAVVVSGRVFAPR